MKRVIPFIIPVALGLLLSSCGNDSSNSQVISQRYIHKFGYLVSKADWEKNKYPGQIITTMRNGVTLTSSYENGVLHGPTTHTYPHSQTVQYFFLYNQGELVKEMAYDSFGMPQSERTIQSANRYTLTYWYADGTPMAIENFAGEELFAGEYFNTLNECQSRIEQGNGVRLLHTPQGALVSRDYFENGYQVKSEGFYPSGSPESLAFYAKNQLHGERKIFAETGEPLATEEWVDGKLSGKVTTFINGAKAKEVYYLSGQKNGLEIHYMDGEKVEQEILWSNDKRHGPTKLYAADGTLAQVEWFYEGKQVSKGSYEEQTHLDRMITQNSADL